MDPAMLEVMLPEDGFIPDPIPVPIPVDIDMANGRADGCNVPVLSISTEKTLSFLHSKRARLSQNTVADPLNRQDPHSNSPLSYLVFQLVSI
jgi:hypothetical protein